MINTIRNYIHKNSGSWPISKPRNPSPLLISNVNYNFIESSPKIARVILWFNEGEGAPWLTSKIMDKSLKRESLDRCLVFQDDLNRRLDYMLYLPVYDVAELDGHTVLFEESCIEMTYKAELRNLIYGPTFTPAYLGRVLARQLGEVGELLERLSQLHSIEKPRRYGAWVHKLGLDFRAACDLEEVLTDKSLERTSELIDSILIPRTPVLAEFTPPNIFPGPKLIDNIIPDIDELNHEQPGLINAFNFLITSFGTPPLSDLWPPLDVLAGAILDSKGETLIGLPIRHLIQSAGLDVNDHNLVWAFVMTAVFWHAINALYLYASHSEMLQKNLELYRVWAPKLVEIQNAFKEMK